jgi:hypothetical protein
LDNSNSIGQAEGGQRRRENELIEKLNLRSNFNDANDTRNRKDGAKCKVKATGVQVNDESTGDRRMDSDGKPKSHKSVVLNEERQNVTECEQ